MEYQYPKEVGRSFCGMTARTVNYFQPTVATNQLPGRWLSQKKKENTGGTTQEAPHLRKLLHNRHSFHSACPCRTSYKQGYMLRLVILSLRLPNPENYPRFHSTNSKSFVYHVLNDSIDQWTKSSHVMHETLMYSWGVWKLQDSGSTLSLHK